MRAQCAHTTEHIAREQAHLKKPTAHKQVASCADLHISTWMVSREVHACALRTHAGMGTLCVLTLGIYAYTHLTSTKDTSALYEMIQFNHHCSAPCLANGAACVWRWPAVERCAMALRLHPHPQTCHRYCPRLATSLCCTVTAAHHGAEG